jgi:hypothetical protein
MEGRRCSFPCKNRAPYRNSIGVNNSVPSAMNSVRS